MSTSTDLLIIGGGPAGLSACLTFSRTGRTSVLYDSGLYRNRQSPAMHTVLGFEGRSPEDYRGKVREELENGYPWAEIRMGKIVKLEKQKGEGEAEGKQGEGVFVAKDGEGREVRAKKVVLATGLEDKLPEIEGLQQFWGTRAIHCIFCHGTETRQQPIAFLFTPNNAKMNPMMAESALKMWTHLNHSKVYFLTHGMEVDTEEGLEQSGLKGVIGIVKKRGYEIITSAITSMAPTSSGDMTIHFASRPTLTVPYLTLFPESFAPNPDAKPLLTESLLNATLAPTGTIPALPSDVASGGLQPIMPPRMGDDPRTSVPGLYWAGNAGSFVANVNVCVGQGQAAGFVAAEELGKEEVAKEKEGL